MLKAIKNVYSILFVFCVMATDVCGMRNVHGLDDKRKKDSSIKNKPSGARGDWSKTGNAVELSTVRTYKLVAAGVLPIIYEERYNQIKVILARQTSLDSVNGGKYDYFAGAVNEEDGGDCLVVAARKWYEGSRLGEILEWSETDAKHFICKNVKGYVVLATNSINKENSYRIMYLVDIGQTDIYQNLFEKFEPSYRQVLQYKENGEDGWDTFLQKDKLVEVNWSNVLRFVQSPNTNQLIPIKWSGETNDKKVELSDAFTDLLQGIDARNWLQRIQLKSQFPLGVFIFSLQKLEEKETKEAGITLQEKIDLNEEIMNQLKNEEIVEEEQPAGVEQASGTKGLDLSTVGTPENPHELKREEGTKTALPVSEEEEKQKGLSKDKMEKIAAAVQVRQNEKTPDQQPPVVPKEEPKEEQKKQEVPSPVQKNPGMLSSIGASVWSGITKLAHFFSDVFNWLGFGFSR